MRKKYFLMLAAVACISGRSVAQQCATDEMHKMYKSQHPEIANYEKQMKQDLLNFMSKTKMSNFLAAKTTASVHNDTDYYDIPVVIHVMHSYGTDLLADNEIYKLMDNMNKFYNAQNDLSAVIPPFVPYIGKAKFRFHLASKDPLGNPSKGITHRYTYLTFGGDDQAKMDLWPPQSYYNIWFENYIGLAISGGTVLAYATFPTSSASNPFYDGVIAGAPFINDATLTIQHESGHYFSLEHPWNSSGAGSGVSCGDDEVDDTPPTKGHFSTCPLYDQECAINYYKIYTNISGGDSLVNYPDTTNTQNVMDYSSCTNMLTKGQVWRMRGALNSNIANRNNLWDSTNLAMTGAAYPYPDLKPVTDFSVKNGTAATYFTFPGVNLTFASKSWGDTITNVDWTFGNGAAVPALTQSTAATVTQNVVNSFSVPGWVNFKMDVTGNNTGVTSTTYDHSVFVADVTALDVSNYYQEFTPGGDRDKWPTFNYYNNEFQWKMVDNVGFYDNSCLMYTGFDTRLNPLLNLTPLTGAPKGDFDDFFTAPVDLSSFTDACNLDFFYSAASRSSSSVDITDSIEITYSVNKSLSWTPLVVLSKSSLINKGSYSFYYQPSSPADWAPKTIALPAAARKPYTAFRFRYKPGGNALNKNSTGNNFYMDRISFSRLPAEASNVNIANASVAVVPNPTKGDAYVIIKGAPNTEARVMVSDITGKVVYSATQQVAGSEAHIIIPHSAITVQGVYIVQTTTGGQVNTQKLVVY
jgi:hypothetical protein